jgi:hypothetical protein
VVTYATTTTLVAKTTTTITIECDDAEDSNAMVEYERVRRRMSNPVHGGAHERQSRM